MQKLFNPLITIYKNLYLFAYDITGNYGISLILLSFFTFVVLYPFNKKAQIIQKKEHKIQAVLAPQIEEIKRQYNGREQYENLQWLYRRYGYHPLYAIRSALGLILQIPFLTSAYYMLSDLAEIQGVSWGIIANLGMPDHLLGGINLLPLLMTLVTFFYAYVMPEISKKERLQTLGIGVFFLVLLYSAPSALLVFWTCNLLWSLLDSVFNEKMQRAGGYIEKNEAALHIIFALAITVGLFVPLEIYIKNADQLWFDLKDIIKFFLMDCIKYFFFLFSVYIICGRIKRKNIYLSVLLGILLGVFLQSYIIGLDYGTFDGHEIDWDQYVKDGFVNTIIWFLCLVVGLCLFYKLKFDEIKLKKHIEKIAFYIIVIQCIVLLMTALKNPIQKKVIYEDGRARVLTTKSIYTVSAKSNIIIFLIDAFDNAVFDEIRHKNPNVVANLKDFTYYPDTTSSFGFTLYSLPEILTGKLYDPSIAKYPVYLKEAWRNNHYYNILKENNYSINLYTSGDYVDKEAPIDNLIAEKVNVDKNVADHFGSLVKFRIVPHYFKYLFYQYDSDFQSSMVMTNNVKPYKLNDRDFYVNLQKGLKLNQKENCFQFYHLQGLHYPWILDENVEQIKSGEKGTAYRSALASLKIVQEYITHMKQHGLYDQATIVVLADHGNAYVTGRSPVFLIKYPFEQNPYLVLDSRPTIVAELMPFIFRRFSENSVLKEVRGTFPSNNTRFFFYEDQDGIIEKYMVKGKANDKTSWVSLGKVKPYQEGDRRYNLGEVIDFSFYGNSTQYKGKGWIISPSERYSVTQNEAELVLNVQNKIKNKEIYNIKVKIDPILFMWALPYKIVTLYANDIQIGQWKFEMDGTQEINCKVSNEIFNKKPLILRFVVDVPKELIEAERLAGRGDVKFIVYSMQIIKKG